MQSSFKTAPLLGLATLAALGLVGTSPQAAHAAPNLIINGGFETGNLSGWNPGTNASYQGVTSAAAHSGSYGYSDGPYPFYGDLSQTISTTPGASYDISFWLQSAGSPSDAVVSFGGVPLLDLVDLPADSYTQYTFVEQASSGSTTLDFQLRTVPDVWHLDDVSVTAHDAPSAPEPSSIATFAFIGLGAAGLILKARKRKALDA